MNSEVSRDPQLTDESKLIQEIVPRTEMNSVLFFFLGKDLFLKG